MIKFIVKLLISAALLAVILRAIEPGAVGAVVRDARPEFLVAALGLVWLSSALAAGRWFWIMRRLGFGGSPGFYLASYFEATFFNQALPSNVGGDAYRVLAASRLGRGTKAAFYGVLIDRGVGLAGLMLLNLAALIARRDLLPAALSQVLIAASAAGVAGVFVFAWAGGRRRIARGLARVRWLAPIGDISARLRAVGATPGAVLLHAGLAVLIHLVATAAMYCIGAGVGLRYDLMTYLVIVPPVVILSLLPISLAGWGLREGGLLGLFMLIGADQARVLSMSVLYGLVWLAAAVPGLALFLARRSKEPVP